MILLVVAAIFLVALWTISLVFSVPLWIAATTTVLVTLALAARFSWKHYQAKKASREIESSLVGQARAFEKKARPDQQAEIQALSSGFERALATLKSSKLAKGREGALYALPWYVIIGPPGAGKSTAIRQSGLKFPLLGAQGSVRGIGGTRNCDWWFTNQAVLLDTAGRYSTEDDDRQEWLEFLDMLRRARTKRPLNGLIVAVSIAEIASASDAALETLAQKLRERIDEVMGRLGVILPVYVLLTKCDLIPGFVESFENLRKTERQQVFGFTFPIKEKKELAARVEEQWTRLCQVVERRALTRAPEARTREARRLIYEFPQQLESLRANVTALFSMTFVDNVYQEAPLVRGVYLTSGTQEGSPIDRVMGAMASAFGLAPRVWSEAPRADVKSYFLGDLFTSVMFPDQELASRNAAADRRLLWIRAGVALLIALFAAGLAVFPASAYVANRALVADAQEHLAKAIAFRAAAKKRAVPLSVLEPLREQLTQLQQWDVEGPPLRYRMGLYQGKQLLPQLRSFYTSTLRVVLVEPLVEQLAEDISRTVNAASALNQAPSVQDHAVLYERTRAYLLLTRPKEPAQPDLDQDLRAWLTAKLVDVWATQSDKPPSVGEREAMKAHIDAYLSLMATDEKLTFGRDRDLVRRSREVLSRVPTVRLAVDRAVAEIEQLGWDLGFEQLVGASGLPISATGRVRGAFTRRAWEEYLRELFSTLPEELLGNPWVLELSTREQDDRTTEARLCALRSEYFGRYVDEWKAFIGTLRVEEPLEQSRALVVLQDLTRGQPPPLERLMRAIAYNAQLGEKKTEKNELEKAAESTGVLDRLREAVQKTPAAALLARKDPCANGAYLTEVDVRRGLEGFFSFGASLQDLEPGAPAQLTPVQVYQEQLTFVRDAVQTYIDDPSTADPLLARLQAARTRVRSLIETQEVGWRPRFDALLWPPINGASASSSTALAGSKGSQWCTSIVLPFNRTLRDRYPFAKHGQDAALADLTEFYRPGSGIVWAFHDSALKRDVPQVGGKFEIAKGSGVGATYSSDLVRFLNRSYHLTSVLFPPRAEKPRVDFEVRVRPSPGIAQVLLTIDGQLVDFHNGPEKWVPITWPGQAGKPGATVRVKGANIDEILTQDGEWGVFRLFEKGTIGGNPGERFFTVRFRLRTQNDVTIDIRPARAENPFVGSKSYLEAFRAEGVLAPTSIAQGAGPCSE